jgi:hypothetical protein
MSTSAVHALNKRLRAAFPYCYAETNRHGNTVVYFRRVKGGKKIRFRSEPFSDQFHLDYANARAGRIDAVADPRPKKPAPASAPSRSVPKTWRWLCEQYFGSPEYRELASLTQRPRRAILEATWDEPLKPGAKQTFADYPLERFRAREIKVLRDRKRTWERVNGEEVSGNIEAANARLKAIRAVLEWAKEEHTDLVERNWAKDVSRLSSDSDGHHTWTLAEIEQFERNFPVGTKARLALHSYYTRASAVAMSCASAGRCWTATSWCSSRRKTAAAIRSRRSCR